MIDSRIIVFISSLILALVAFYLSVLIRRKTQRNSKELQLSLPVLGSVTPNIHQVITYYSSGTLDTVEYLFTTYTFCDIPFFKYLLPSTVKSTLHINVGLNKKSPSFFIYKKNISLNHSGKSLSKKYLLNQSKYNVFGVVTDEIDNFILKYDFDYFYSSYLPQNFTDRILQFNCLEIKIDSNLVNEKFLTDFLSVLKNLQSESDGRCQRIIKEHDLLRKQDREKNNKGFLDKVKEQAKKSKKK